jgi:hypothetical protein
MRAIKWLVLCGLAAIPILLGLLWLDHNRDTPLPAPTGSFAVGRLLYDWIDDKTVDARAPQPGTKRELLVWIWYPATVGKSAVDDYVPASVRGPALQTSSGLIFRAVNWVFELTRRDLSKVRGHSLRDADVSPQQPAYPVVFMRAGGTREVMGYSTLAEDLASHGYITVGLDAPYRTGRVVFPDGRAMERSSENNLDLVDGEELVDLATKLTNAWSADMRFALDQLERLNASDPSGKFTGRLDLQRVGAFGHSIGGAQALQFCHDDSRCKASIDVDGLPFGSVVREGLLQPVMFLFSDHGGESGSEAREATANFGSMFNHLPTDQWTEIMIRGANHYMFSDDAILRSPPLMRVLRAANVVRIDGSRQVAVAEYSIRTFFDVYLKGAPASELKAPGVYAEIEYLH